MKRLGGLKDLVFDAVEEVTSLVERTHRSVADRSMQRFVPIEPLATSVRAVQTVHEVAAGGVYDAIRAVNRGVKQVLAAGTPLFRNNVLAQMESEWLDQGTPIRSDAAATWPWLLDHGESVLNALFGDYLHHRGNGLDLGMTLREQGRALTMERGALKRFLPGATGKVVIFIHGLGCTEWSWSIGAEEFYGDAGVNFGSMLARDFGITPLYVRYNTGRHISENGKHLSSLLERLMATYPAVLQEIILIGHSMGGLVARSAVHHGQARDLAWVRRTKHLFCLGSPHLGAPLEKFVDFTTRLLWRFPTAGTEVPAAVFDSRSAGIKDLRWGYTPETERRDLEVDDVIWNENSGRPPFVPGINYYLIGATVTQGADHPLGQLIGDLLVRPASATGKAPQGQRPHTFTTRAVISGVDHFHLTNHPDVYAVIQKNMVVKNGKVPA